MPTKSEIGTQIQWSIGWLRSNLANSSASDRAVATDNRALATNSPYAYSPFSQAELIKIININGPGVYRAVYMCANKLI